MLALRNQAENNPSVVLNFNLLVSGIYIWEVLTTLDYEWRIIRGHQRYRWTIWIYSISRLSGLMVVILTYYNYGIMSEDIDCQAWIVTCWVFITLGCYALASILIILRIFAIWNRNKIILAITFVIWVSNLGYQMTGGVNIRGVWVPSIKACRNAHIPNYKGLALSGLVTDVTLLLIMLAGLLRLRSDDGTFIDLAYILWKQGVIWLVIAIASQFPQVMFMFLNVHASLIGLFAMTATTSIVIAGTRMYRDLTYYASTPPDTTGPGRMTNTKNPCTVQIPSNRMEVKEHKSFEEYPMAQMNHCGSHYGTDGQLVDKPRHGLGLDDNV